MRETTRKIFGPKVADKTGPVWGLDNEGEIQGIWRRSGHPGCVVTFLMRMVVQVYLTGRGLIHIGFGIWEV